MTTSFHSLKFHKLMRVRFMPPRMILKNKIYLSQIRFGVALHKYMRLINLRRKLIKTKDRSKLKTQSTI